MLSWNSDGLKKLLDRISMIERRLRASGTLKRQLGRLLVAQTKRRLTDEKTSPEGEPWEPWSETYAATRGAGHSLLIDTGTMLNSIKARVTKEGSAVSTDVPYGSVHQKHRPFLGVSSQNSDEIEEMVYEWALRTL